MNSNEWAMGEAARRWERALAEWEIPQHILERAPESPWCFPTSLFRLTPQQMRKLDNPSYRRALEVLPAGGSVLDVGVGAGAASLPLVPPARRIVGVDASADMLEAFAAAADEIGAERVTVLGRWPEVAERTPPADLVVCHHVLYNVADLGRFVTALTEPARQRVVVELTDVHPAVTLNDLWLHFHGLERPSGPTAADALAVLRDIGLRVEVERWTRPPRTNHLDRAEVVGFVRRRLCLTAERDDEIDRLLGDAPVFSPREVATLWWAGRAPEEPQDLRSLLSASTTRSTSSVVL